MTHQQELFGNPPRGPMFTDPIQLKEFVLAGRAKLTLKSKKTGQHYTYKIRKGDDAEKWFVHRLTSDNEYLYLGTIFNGHGFVRTRKTNHRDFISPQFMAFNWFWTRLSSGGGIHPQLEAYHEGRCGMCGLELTDPDSINLGYGPDCRRKKFARPPIQKDRQFPAGPSMESPR